MKMLKNKPKKKETLFENDSSAEVPKRRILEKPTTTKKKEPEIEPSTGNSGGNGNILDLSDLRVGGSGPLDPGVYDGIIRQVKVEKMEDKFSEDAELRDVVVFEIEAWNDERTFNTKYFTNLSLHTSSKFVLALEALGVDYLTIDTLDLGEFENMPVKVRLGINQNKPEYNKVLEIWKDE